MNKNIVTQKFLTEKIANCGGGGGQITVVHGPTV